MNIIEKKYEYAKIAVETLKEIEKSKGKQPHMAIENFYFIVPTSNDGLKWSREIDAFLTKMEANGVIIIREYGRDVSIEEIEDQINLSMSISKKNIQDTIVKHNLVATADKIGGEEILMERLKTDSLPE